MGCPFAPPNKRVGGLLRVTENRDDLNRFLYNVSYDIMTVFSIVLAARLPLCFSAFLVKTPIRIKIRQALRLRRHRRCLKARSKITSQKQPINNRGEGLMKQRSVVIGVLFLVGAAFHSTSPPGSAGSIYRPF